MIKVKSIKTFLALIGFYLFIFKSVAQLPLYPNFLVKNYSKKEIGISSQNWSALQDFKGQLLVANNIGVLINNGQRWKILNLTDGADARSLAKDSQHRIYVGGNNQLGYLYYNHKGKINFQSLKSQLNEAEKKFTDVWTTLVLPDDKILFQSHEYVFIFNNGKKICSFHSDNGFHKSFKVDNHILVRENDIGLEQVVNNQLSLIKGGDFFANKKIDAVLPYKSNKWIFIGRGFGLLMADIIINNGRIEIEQLTPLNNKVSDELIKNQVYYAIINPYGGYIVATLLNGIYFLDNNFNIIHLLNKENGLSDNKIFYLYLDVNNNLWATSESGVSLIEISLPLSHWSEKDGLEGAGQDMLITSNKLYVATGLGLYKYNFRNKFEKIPESPIEIWTLLSVNNKIYFGSSSGFYELINNRPYLINDFNTHYLGVDPKGNIVQAGDGYVNIFEPNNLTKTIKEYDFTGLVIQVYFDTNGMWISTRDNGIIYYDNNDVKTEIAESSRQIDVDEVTFFTLNNQLLLAGSGGIYTPKFINNKPVIIPYMLDAKIDTLTKFNIYKLTTNTAGDISYLSYYEENNQTMHYLKKTANGYKDYSALLARVVGGKINKILFNKNNLWMVGDDGLYEFNTLQSFKQRLFNPVIDYIVSNNDTIFYGIFPSSTDSTLLSNNQLPEFFPTLNYDHHIYKITFSATSFENADKVLFSSYLEGFENTYSPWQQEPFRTYTNIKEGKYTFHLKAKDVYGNISPEITFTFEVLPPWYRTWWAYVIYAVGLVYGIYLIVQLNIKRLKKKNQELEDIITDRTAEIRRQKDEIEHQKKEITDSINYAKRIQGAVLPTRQRLEEDFKNVFVLYLPKDIVSGDFYFLTKVNLNDSELDIIAAADCTGHGVPGAFMSMIGIKILEQAVFESNDYQPDKILYRLNEEVNKFLRQNENKSRDGMEIALCVIDYKKMHLKFALANRPLWLIRNNQLIDFKPTKLPIGGVQEEGLNEYVLNEIDLQKDDIIYIFSDGFADQFGGAEGKKLMTKRFKEELLKVSQLPIEQQQETLQQFILGWKGDFEQVDDILVIGIKI